MEEDTSEEDEHMIGKQQVSVENSKRSLILRVGKKIVITGVLISSAPFVLPPLIVASTIGFAFSVPFGLVFASYACTEKVMSVLLPTPNVDCGGTIEDYGVEEEEIVEDEVYEEIPQEERKLKGVEENESQGEVEDDTEVDGMVGRTDDTEVDDKVEDDPRVVEIKDVMEKMQDKMVGQQEVDGVGEEKMDDKKVDVVEGAAALRRTDDTEVDDKVEEDPTIVEINDVVEEKRIGELEDSMIEEEKPIIQGREVKALLIREGADESGSDLFGEKAAASEVQHGSVGVLSAKEEHSSSMTGEENVAKLRTEAQPAVSASKMEKISSSSKEVPYNEHKIWELINSMRKVVGYKAARQPTFFEELKALYIFTGVNPPVAFKDPLDLVEISDKLRLLMSIVGVK